MRKRNKPASCRSHRAKVAAKRRRRFRMDWRETIVMAAAAVVGAWFGQYIFNLPRKYGPTK